MLNLPSQKVRPIIRSYLSIRSIKVRRHGGSGGSGGGTEERASSTADEFKKVAEEKVKLAEEQGLASQTVDKASDGAEEAFRSGSNGGKTKKRYEEHEEGKNYRKSGDGDEDDKAPVNTVKGP